MKLLLTSAGFTNKSIANALLELCGRPFSELKLDFHSHRGQCRRRRQRMAH